MPLTVQPLPFGLRDVTLTPIDSAGTLGTPVDLPVARTLSFTEAEDFTELRGDDQLITSRGSGPVAQWELEEGGISLEAYLVMAGGFISTTGTTPNQRKHYRKKVTDSRPFFRIQGQAISDSGGDFHVIIYKCRATGDLEGELSDGGFWITKCKGDSYGMTVGTVNDCLYDFIQNETTTTNAAES